MTFRHHRVYDPVTKVGGGANEIIVVNVQKNDHGRPPMPIVWFTPLLLLLLLLLLSPLQRLTTLHPLKSIDQDQDLSFLGPEIPQVLP